MKTEEKPKKEPTVMINFLAPKSLRDQLRKHCEANNLPIGNYAMKALITQLQKDKK